MRNRIMIGIGAGLLLIAVVAGAQQVKRTLSAVIKANELEYDWGANVFEFTGNSELKITGRDEALMQAQKMTVKLNDKQNQVQELRTTGATNFTITTAPDAASGQRRRIVASCQDGALYSEATQQVVLSGGAKADMSVVPPSATAQAVHLEGDQITLSLKTMKVKVTPAHVEVTGGG
jgi:lipopolysaccharide export system protein LptA